MQRSENSFELSVKSETPPIPGWEKVRRDDSRFFPEGSLGYSLFPDQLEGRWRPMATWLQSDVAYFFPSAGNISMVNALREGKYYTVGDVLHRIHSPSESLETHTRRALESLLVSPHQRLDQAILVRPDQPDILSPEDDRKLIEQVETQVNNLSEEQTAVIRLLYGLQIGVAEPVGMAAGRLGRSSEDIRAIHEAALDRLRSFRANEMAVAASATIVGYGEEDDNGPQERTLSAAEENVTGEKIGQPAPDRAGRIEPEVVFADRRVKILENIALSDQQLDLSIDFLPGRLRRILKREMSVYTIRDLQGCDLASLYQKRRIIDQTLVGLVDDVQAALGIRDCDLTKRAAKNLHRQQIISKPIDVDAIRLEMVQKEALHTEEEQRVVDALISQAMSENCASVKEIQHWLWAHQGILSEGKLFGLDSRSWTVTAILRSRINREAQD